MPVTFSFGGAGHHFPFMMGVAHGLRSHFDLDWNLVHAHGVSSGSTGAMCLLICTPVEIDQLVRQGIAAAQLTCNIRREDYFVNIIKSMMPVKAYALLGERLIVGQTQLPFFNAILKKGPFENQAALIDTVYDSCRIPLFTSGMSQVLDGGFSHQYAVVDDNTIVVTLKRKRRSDIALRGASYFLEMLLPSPGEMMKLYTAGQELVANNLERLTYKINAGLNDFDTPVHFHPTRG